MSDSQIAVLNTFYPPQSQSKNEKPDSASPEMEEPYAGMKGEAKGTPKLAMSRPKTSKEYVAILRQLYEELGPGWVYVTTKDCLPKKVCYAACYNDTNASVTPKGMEALTNLTILIIDAATRDTTQTPDSMEKAAEKGAVGYQRRPSPLAQAARI